MRIFKTIALAAAVIAAFLSCQKEISFDTGGKSIGEFLKDAGGDCTPAVVNGIFKQDTVLATDANFVDVQVTVSNPGSFDIKSDTVNGYSFSKTGNVAFGNNTIRLYANGKPIVAGTNTFTITYGSNTCSFDITVTGSGVLPAEFTLGSIAGICAQAIQGGTYTVGVPLTPSNTLTVQVSVTKAGNYILGAISPAGFLFSGSGTFTTLGLQTVTLTGTGKPTAPGIAVVTVTNIASTCTYAITVQPPTPPAVFTLDGAPNTCTGAIVSGTYAATVATAATNTATLKVNVTTAGTYTITTNTANGISFSKTGTFTTTGAQTIVLTAIGTPSSAGTFVFKPNVTTTCDFSVTVQPAPPPATFTLSGAPAACAPITVNGAYAVASALGASNTAVVQVNVLTTGVYTLTTNTVNGMTFSKSGLFTAAGIQNVTLQGSGTPIAAGTSTLKPQIGTSSCTFDVVVTAAPTGIYTCKIDGVVTTFNDRAKAEVLSFGTPNLFLDGYNSAPLPGGGFVPGFQIFIDKNDASPVGAGTYDEKNLLLPNGYRIEIDYKAENPDQSVTIWNTSSNLLSVNPPFTIIVTSVTATRVKGTFSGRLTNTLQGSTLFKTITEGVFDLPIQ
jgi:hypothetical protein